jgi:predicted transcriptional regulator of viral defense system
MKYDYYRKDYMMEDSNSVRSWIELLPKKGIMTFSLEDIKNQFPEMRSENIKNSLLRQSRKGKIQSVWRGFYAIVPYEYGLRGIVPPVEYIYQSSYESLESRLLCRFVERCLILWSGSSTTPSIICPS